MVVPHDGHWARVIFGGALTPACRGAVREQRGEALLTLCDLSFCAFRHVDSKNNLPTVSNSEGFYCFGFFKNIDCKEILVFISQ